MNQENQQSLDPRINRLFADGDAEVAPKPTLDQLPTFEVFLQIKEGKPFEHAGIVHAPDEDLAFVFAKEQYSRRGNTCTGMFVIPTQEVLITEVLAGNESVYDHLPTSAKIYAPEQSYEVFHLKKRGKQQVHKGRVVAVSSEDALHKAKELYYEHPCPNIWIAPTSAVSFSFEADKVIWSTLHEKKYREAIAYKAGDKLAKFKAEQALING